MGKMGHTTNTCSCVCRTGCSRSAEATSSPCLFSLFTGARHRVSTLPGEDPGVSFPQLTGLPPPGSESDPEPYTRVPQRSDHTKNMEMMDSTEELWGHMEEGSCKTTTLYPPICPQWVLHLKVFIQETSKHTLSLHFPHPAPGLAVCSSWISVQTRHPFSMESISFSPSSCASKHI